VLRDNPKALKRYFSYCEYSEALLTECRSELTTELDSDSVERAGKWLFSVFSSFGGHPNKGFAYSMNGKNHPSTLNNKVKLICSYAKRFKQCYIFNRSYEVILNKFDGKDSFFYLDPPYANTEKYSIQSKDSFDYDEFISRVCNLKGDWIVSHYYDYVAKDFECRGYQVVKLNSVTSITRSNGESRHQADKGGECIILSKGISSNLQEIPSTTNDCVGDYLLGII
jgi:site-specific DNA-adenine methylase